MYYTIYRVTNKINGKFYIGKHQTSCVYDDYYGSGKNIKRAIKKYGKENFYKEVLFVFNTEQEMNDKEKEIITEEFVANKRNYNVGVGGEGGPHFKDKKHSTKTKNKLRDMALGKKLTDESKQKISEIHKGKITSKETKEKISKSRKKAYEISGKKYDNSFWTEVQEKYDLGLSLREISKEFKISVSTINAARKRNKLKTRDISSAMKIFCGRV